MNEKTTLAIYREHKVRIFEKFYDNTYASVLMFRARMNCLMLNWRLFKGEDNSCRLCQAGKTETLEHFLMKFKALAEVRRQYKFEDCTTAGTCFCLLEGLRNIAKNLLRVIEQEGSRALKCEVCGCWGGKKTASHCRCKNTSDDTISISISVEFQFQLELGLMHPAGKLWVSHCLAFDLALAAATSNPKGFTLCS